MKESSFASQEQLFESVSSEFKYCASRSQWKAIAIEITKVINFSFKHFLNSLENQVVCKLLK